MDTQGSVALWLTCVSLVFVAIQVLLLRKQAANDHERSRRERVIDLQKLWLEYCKDYKPRMIRRLVGSLDEESCKKIWNDDSIVLPASCEMFLGNLLDCPTEKLKKEAKNGTIVLDGEQFLCFRTHLSNYLNLYEVIFTAWRNNIGDREMIEMEFGKLISKDNRVFPLDQIVNSSYGFPSIKKFSLHLRQKNSENIVEKPPLS